MDIDELYDETIRLGDVQELADRLVWIWRMTSYRVRCETGTCHVSEDKTPDPTELIINFRDALIRDLVGELPLAPDKINTESPVVKFAELLAVQTMKRSVNIELREPEHQWVAAEVSEARCTCGWSDSGLTEFGASAAWEEHAAGHGGPGLELLPWQSVWLEKFNTAI